MEIVHFKSATNSYRNNKLSSDLIPTRSISIRIIFHLNQFPSDERFIFVFILFTFMLLINRQLLVGIDLVGINLDRS